MPYEKDKNQYPSPGSPEENTPQVPDNNGFLKHVGTSDKSFIFQYKKTEKILAALYLITNFLSADEPLRREVREKGLGLLADVMSLKDALPSQKEELCNVIKTTVLEIISLLEIAFIAGLISSMNFEVLRKELVATLDSISHSKQALESLILPENFFAEEQTENATPTTPTSPFNLPSPPQKPKKVAQNIAIKASTPRTEPKNSYGAVEIKRNNRQSIIIDLLKKKKEIMVKDVAPLIDNCSEKTIQRELLSMVDQGILKKQGERRWSRYSLA